MNISVTNGFDLKVSQSISLNNEIEEFLKRGGKVRTVVGCTGTKKDFGYIGLDKKEEKPKKERKKSETTDGMVKRNNKLAVQKEARKLVQMPILAEYKSWSSEYRWLEIQKLTGIKKSKLTAAYLGYITFIDDAEWKSVVDAISVLRVRHESGEEVGGSKGNNKNVLDKEARMKEQVKILSEFRESYKGRGALARLEDRTGILSSTYGMVLSGKTTIANAEKWQETLDAISELMGNN